MKKMIAIITIAAAGMAFSGLASASNVHIKGYPDWAQEAMIPSDD